MDRTSKFFSLLFIVILAVPSLITVESAFAQSIPKPSVPQFTIKTSDHSYDIPPTYGIDQFTGQNITVHEGAHYQWRTLDFAIVNQQAPIGFGPYFNIRYKGQYTDSWTELYHAGTYISQQSGQYSTIPFLLSGSYPSTVLGDLYRLNIPTGVRVDFQVQTLVGTTTRGSAQFGSGDAFTGQASDWSNIQTVTIGETVSISPNPTQTPTPSVPEFSWLTILPLLFSIPIVLIASKKRLHGKLTD